MILTVCALCIAPQVLAQPGYLAGHTYEYGTQAGLPYVHVGVAGENAGSLSDQNGYFLVGPLPAGAYQLALSRIGYVPVQADSVVIIPGDTAVLNIYLQAVALLSDEVVITATRKTQDIHLAPASASVVTSEDIAKRTLTTFDEALDLVPGVTVSRSGGANVQSLSIRGASETAGGGTGNRVLLLIDGRPATSPESGGPLWNLVPLNSLERIEVVKGAYSALFGSSAMGGVINAITKTPGEEGLVRLDASYGFYQKAPDFTGYTKFNDFHALGLSYSRNRGKWSYLFDGVRKVNDGHREKSGFELYNSYLKLRYAFAPNRSLQLSANLNDLHNDTPATWLNRTKAYSVADHRRDDFQNKREFSTDLHYSALTSSRVQYSSRFYFYQNFSEYLFNDDPGNDSTNVNQGKQFIDRETIRASRVGNITQVDWSPHPMHYAIVGVDLKYDRTSGLPDTVLYGRHNAFQAGVFVQDEWTVNRKFTITAGARYDHYAIIDGFMENNFSPKVAMVYAFDAGLSVRALFAQAFRNPAIAERYIKFEQGGGLTFMPNPDLRAEKLDLSSEIGVYVKVSGKLSFDIAGYYNHYRDLISFEQLSAPGEPLVFQVVNLKKARMRGMEVGVSYRPFVNFTLAGAYAYLDAQDISPGRINSTLAYKARHTASLATSFHQGSWEFNVDGRLRSRLEEVFIYPGSEPEGYVLFNSKVIYNFNSRHCVYVAVSNIGNVRYEELERYRLAGRSFAAGCTLNF